MRIDNVYYNCAPTRGSALNVLFASSRQAFEFPCCSFPQNIRIVLFFNIS